MSIKSPGLGVLAVIVTLLGTGASASAQCLSQGPVLGISGGRLGDPLAISVTGAPNAVGALGIDIGGGTGLGPVCLDFSFAFLALPIGLDGTGALTISVALPPDPVLDGLSLFMQAGLADPQPPFALLSNGGRLDLRAPHVYALERGDPLFGTPATLVACDVLSDTVTFNATFGGRVEDVVHVPSLSMVAGVRVDGVLEGFDRESGLGTYAVALPTDLSNAIRLFLAPDGQTLIIVYQGVVPTLFSGGVPGGVRVVDLPTGTVNSTLSLPVGNPSGPATLVPGTTKGYVAVGSTVVPFDYASGTLLPAIPIGTGMGNVVDVVAQGTTLFTLLAGSPAATNAVDTTTDTVLFPTPVSGGVAGLGTKLRYGPGTAGNALFILYAAGLLVEVNPSTLAPMTTVSLNGPAQQVELSSGGTEWLVFQSGSSTTVPPSVGVLRRVDPATLSVTTVATLTATDQFALLPLRSNALSRAHFLSGSAGGFDLLRVLTDPVGMGPVQASIVGLGLQPALPLRLIGE